MPHADPGASRKRDRLLVVVDVLPVEVPVADLDQRHDTPVRQLSRALEVPTEVMRVRLHRVDDDVDRQLVGVGCLVVAITGRDVQVLSRQSQHHRQARRRGVAEVQPQAGLHGLGFPARLQVEHDDQVARAVQRPRGSFDGGGRPVAGRPVEEEAVRRACRQRHDAFITRRVVSRVEPARQARSYPSGWSRGGRRGSLDGTATPVRTSCR